MTAWTVACQAPLSMGFPRQEYESGLAFPFAGDLPDPETESMSPTFFTFIGKVLRQAGSLPLNHQEQCLGGDNLDVLC